MSQPAHKELLLSGDLVLRHIARLKGEILTALEENDHLLLDLSAAKVVDLPFLQLLCSAHRSAVQRNKSLGLTGEIPDDFRRKLDAAGFLRHVGCGLDCPKTCIWTGRDD